MNTKLTELAIALRELDNYPVRQINIVVGFKMIADAIDEINRVQSELRSKCAAKSNEPLAVVSTLEIKPTSNCNRGTLSVAKTGEVISDQPSIAQCPGCDDVDHYGGYLIAETVTPSNAARIVATWNACKGIENLEAIGKAIAFVKEMANANTSTLKSVGAHWADLANARDKARNLLAKLEGKS